MNGMMYYLLSSLPSENTNQPQETFYGLSPGGLARGGLLMDYQGIIIIHFKNDIFFLKDNNLAPYLILDIKIKYF